VTATRRDEEKLWLILFRIKSVRARLNFLALQDWLFTTLAFLIGGAATIFAAALYLSPLAFLVTVIIVAFFTLAVTLRVARRSLRNRATSVKAAAIAEERAALKGRLSAVLAMANAPAPSQLWPYLLEDTYGLRGEFEPARIEPRWISRSVLNCVAAAMVAILLLALSLMPNGGPSGGMLNARAPEISADIDNLDIRPADPALEPNAEIFADPATLRKLANKLAAGQNDDGNETALSKWMNKARGLGADLQDQVSGRKSGTRPPVRLRLTAKNDRESKGSHQPAGPGGSNGQSKDQGGKAGSNPPGASGSQGAAKDKPPLPAPMPGQQGNEIAGNGPVSSAQSGTNGAEPGQNPSDMASAAGSGSGGMSNHGPGSDPQHLFGAPTSQPLGSDNFRITIDAQASDESSTPGAPAYIPPKVRVPLNSNQYPDEPLARASIPAADQTTIKRVFER
jgi:hypothetical protein